MEALDRLAEFLVDTNYKDIPRDVVEYAKDLTIDFVGETLAGTVTTVGKIMLARTKKNGGAREATVIGGGFKVPAAAATLANTTIAHSTELESVGIKTGPNSTMVHPAVLALAEKLKLDGKAVIEATVLGQEVQGAFYESTPTMTTHGWDVASVMGTFGAAAGAAKLLKLNPPQVKMVFSMAASGACGFIQQTGSSTHYLEFGIVARHGVEAAELIKAGFTAQEDIFWRPRTFGPAFCGEGGYDFSKLDKNLGRPYRITGVNIKKYSCCFRTHRAIDATLQLMTENNLKYDDVAGVDVDMNQYDADLLRYPAPESGQQSRFSMPHTVASAILGEVTVKNFTDEFVHSPKAVEARKKVKATLRTDWSPERAAARTPVTIRTKDGKSFTKDLDFPVQPSKEQFLARHRQCCELVFKPAQIEEFTNAMQHLEDVDDLESVMKMVRG